MKDVKQEQIDNILKQLILKIQLIRYVRNSKLVMKYFNKQIKNVLKPIEIAILIMLMGVLYYQIDFDSAR